jgi:hypothetical protein
VKCHWGWTWHFTVEQKLQINTSYLNIFSLKNNMTCRVVRVTKMTSSSSDDLIY